MLLTDRVSADSSIISLAGGLTKDQHNTLINSLPLLHVCCSKLLHTTIFCNNSKFRFDICIQTPTIHPGETIHHKD